MLEPFATLESASVRLTGNFLEVNCGEISNRRWSLAPQELLAGFKFFPALYPIP